MNSPLGIPYPYNQMLQIKRKGTPEPKRLTPIELEHSVARLNKSPNRDRKEELAAEPKKIQKDELDSFFERNYTRLVEKNLKKREADEKTIAESLHKANAVHIKPQRDTLSRKEEEWIEKMYTQPLKKRDITLQQLNTKLSAQIPSHVKKMSSEEQDEAVDRLFKKSIEHRRQLLHQAEERVYGKPTERHVLPKDRIAESVNHLFKDDIAKRNETIQRLEEETLWKPKKRIALPKPAA